MQDLNHLGTLLRRLKGESGEESLEQRKKVMNYIRFTDEELVIRQVRQIRDRVLLRQLLGVGVPGRINLAVNARLDSLGG
jgi:hypothetical protein